MIAFDASASDSGSGLTTSRSWNHTCSGGNRILIVGIWVDSTANDVITGVTYAGIAMTRVNRATIDTFNQVLYVLVNPPTGTNSVTVSFTGTQNLLMGSASYTGASGIGANNTATAGVGSTSISASVTTALNNSWLVAQYGNNGGSSSAGSNSYQRQTEGSTNRAIYDTNGPDSPAGSYAINVNVTSSPQNSILNVMEITPAPIAWFGEATHGRIARFFGRNPSLVAYFQLKGNAIDRSGNGRDGAESNMAYTPVRLFDLAGKFNGSSSKVIGAASLGISGSGSRTFLAWFYSDATTADQAIIGTGNYQIAGAGLSLFAHRTEAGTGGLGTNIAGSGSAYTASGIFKQNTLVFVAMTYPAGGDLAAIKFFVDGRWYATTTANNTTPNTQDTALYIGAAHANTDFGYFSGQIVEAAAFNEKIPDNLIEQYYQWASKRKNGGVIWAIAAQLFSEAVTATVAGAATLAKVPEKLIAATIAGSSSVLKEIPKAITATIASVASFVKEIPKAITATIKGTGTTIQGIVYLVAETATIAGSATVQATRVILQAVTATIAGSATVAMTKSFVREAAATIAGSAVTVAGILYGVTVEATIAGSAAVERGIGKMITATISAWGRITEMFYRTKYRRQGDEYTKKY